MRTLVPKLSSPMAKFIRTGEGVLVYLMSVVLVIIPIIQSHLSPTLHQSLVVGRDLALATVVCRSGLKGIALLKGITGVAPQQFNPALGQDLEKATGKVGGQVEQDLSQGSSAEKIVDQIAEDEPLAVALVSDAREFSKVPPDSPAEKPETAARPDGPPLFSAEAAPEQPESGGHLA